MRAIAWIWSLSISAHKIGATDAGWSSSVARWAHNPEVVGSNPAPATNTKRSSLEGLFAFYFFYSEEVVKQLSSKLKLFKRVLGEAQRGWSGSLASPYPFESLNT